MDKRIEARHGVVCRRPGAREGYFGWPTVARLDDGRVIVASSGLRTAHVCPWGKTVLNTSADEGATWSEPRVINDSPIDDRDAGVVNLGGGRVLVSWFTSDTRAYFRPGTGEVSQEREREREREREWSEEFAAWDEALVDRHLGSWVMLSADGGETWGEPWRAPVTAPHGPALLEGGDLLYLGKNYANREEFRAGGITAARSGDGGRTWRTLGAVPVADRTDRANYHEPHAVELPSGRLLGLIRIQDHGGKDLAAAGIPHFSMMQTASDDGGATWSPPRPLGFHGSPPHLMRHSSGTIVLSYGRRLDACGQRVSFSRDEGATWDHDWIIRDDGPDADLGYPSTVELGDGGLLTVYYQKVAGDEKASLLCSRWRLPRPPRPA